MSDSLMTRRVLMRAAGAVTALGALLAGPVGAQITTFNACYVPSVGAMYLIKRENLPSGCLSPAHVEVTWTAGGTGGTVTSITAGPGLLGGTITASGTLSVNFASSGSATTVARSDHTHAAPGSNNTAVGTSALASNTAGGNTAVGASALGANTAGGGNTALGANALSANTTGGLSTAVGTNALASSVAGGNTAVGAFALDANTSGLSNTALGENTLGANVLGNNNTALGRRALLSSTASDNTAVGAFALEDNTTGTGNTAVGALALDVNTTGESNTAVGSNALGAHRIGASNTAVGSNALNGNTSGTRNTAVGADALAATSTAFGSFDNTAVGKSALGSLGEGSENIALGRNAGLRLASGFDNIYIGNDGPLGGFESGVMRIGSSHSSTFIAGIQGKTSSSGVPVLINVLGQLGTTTSSARAKEAVEELGEASRRLLRLRPVQFRYKREYDDGSRLVQYGLIAEEVAEVFPELVLSGPSGEVETVRYHLLAPLLLNELQRQERELVVLRQMVEELRAELRNRTR